MGWYFFIFVFPLLAFMVTDTAFRKFSLGKLVLKKFSLALLIIGHIIQTC